jgi:hypothetical protein
MSKKRLTRWCRASGLEIERWYDRYIEHDNWWRYPLIWTFDCCTLRLFHEWFTYQLQCRCRRVRPLG